MDRDGLSLGPSIHDSPKQFPGETVPPTSRLVLMLGASGREKHFLKKPTQFS